MKLYRKAARIQTVVCGFLFSVFSIVYLYVFQPYVLEALHFSLAHGKTRYAPLASAITLTLVLALLQIVVCRLFRLKKIGEAVAYFPSFLILGALTDVGRSVYTSHCSSSWPWLLPLVLSVFAGLLFLFRRWQEPEPEDSGMTVQWNGSLGVMLSFACMTVAIGNTDTGFHHELEMEYCLRQGDYARALRVGERVGAPTRTQTALRAFALSHTGRLGDRLFEFPQPYGSAGLFFPADSAVSLRFTNDSLYALLGARPAAGKNPVEFLRALCYEEQGKHTALDYYLSALLLDKRLEDFVQAVEDFCEAPDSLPRHYQEALAQYQATHARTPALLSDSTWLHRYAAYQSATENGGSLEERRKAARESFGTTYWWYADFQ